MSRKTIPILAQKRFFRNWLRRLPKAVESQVERILKRDVVPDDDDIEDKVASALRLEPLVAGELRAILIEVDQRISPARSGWSEVSEEYHMEAFVP